MPYIMNEESPSVSWFQLYPNRLLWFSAKLIMLILTVLVLIGLALDIRFASLNGLSVREVFWMVLMPIVVMTMYFSPMLWRNVCPLASVNLWHFSLFGRKRLCKGKQSAHQCSIPMKRAHEFLRKKGLMISAFLFWIIVPARLFLFNASSEGTFWLLIGVFLTAAVMGFLFPVKSGWCTSICPIAAAEKTYGLNPAFSFKNKRCNYYSFAQKRVLNCSGCSFNCGDVVDPEHAYWQASSNKVFHDTVNASMRKIFVATLPMFILSFYFIANNIVVLPQVGMLQKALFVYGFFAGMMIISCMFYMGVKSILRRRVESMEGPLHLEQPSVLYSLYKRRLDLSFVLITMNIIWIASSYAIVRKVIGKVFPSFSYDGQIILWGILVLIFLFVSLFGFRNGWSETSEPGHYKTSWW